VRLHSPKTTNSPASAPATVTELLWKERNDVSKSKALVLGRFSTEYVKVYYAELFLAENPEDLVRARLNTKMDNMSKHNFVPFFIQSWNVYDENCIVYRVEFERPYLDPFYEPETEMRSWPFLSNRRL
jgi:hypothetical protein